MKIDKWIKDYAEDNGIEIPDGIDETNTAINFLRLNSGSGLPEVTSADDYPVFD